MASEAPEIDDWDEEHDAQAIKRRRSADDFPAVSTAPISIEVPSDLPRSVRELMNYCRRATGHDDGGVNAEEVIREARIELVKAHVESALFLRDHLARMLERGYRTEAEALRITLSPELDSMEWQDADELAKAPWRMVDSDGYAARVLFSRTQDRRVKQPKFTGSQLLHGIALSWVLEAVRATDHATALALMSEAGHAVNLAGYGDGWDDAVEYYTTDLEKEHRVDALRQLSKRATSARHAENRSMKAECIDWYKKNCHRFDSKDAAAIEALNRWPVAFTTIRNNWIKGV